MSSGASGVRSAGMRPANDGRYRLSFGRGARHRQIALAPGTFYALATIVPAIAAVYLGATAYLFFRDDMISALMARHARQQYAYEDRLANLRLQLDRVAGRQMLDQDSFDGKLREMASRQARIETRAAVLASLGDAMGLASADAASSTVSTKVRSPGLAPTARAKPVPVMLEATAPIDNPEPAPMRPRPEETGLRPSADASGVGGAGAHLTLADVASDDVPAQLRMSTLTHAIEQTESAQVLALRRLEAPAVALANKLQAAVAITGLSAERLKPPGGARPQDAVGGPFVPLPLDGRASAFDSQLARTQAAVLSLDAVRRTIPTLPLRKPLAGTLEQTSSFGYRLDPFLGRPALHSGIDFRGEYGSTVQATAGGTVVTAGWTGGYGNMVEIEHANGVSTRYGHLSAILVSEGQTVQAGAPVGRVGSTGRSTGNHLHYEVRIDDEAVDPSRFIRAATVLASD